MLQGVILCHWLSGHVFFSLLLNGFLVNSFALPKTIISFAVKEKIVTIH